MIQREIRIRKGKEKLIFGFLTYSSLGSRENGRLKARVCEGSKWEMLAKFVTKYNAGYTKRTYYIHFTIIFNQKSSKSSPFKSEHEKMFGTIICLLC